MVIHAETWRRGLFLLAFACTIFFVVRALTSSKKQTSRKLVDPAAWGEDHVGGSVPDYVTGGECLFCHRKDIGAQWAKNRHHLTIRSVVEEPKATQAAAASLKGTAQFVLGGKKNIRFLRRSGAYGKLDLHSQQYDPVMHKLSEKTESSWESHSFGKNCAGCHTTGVDAKTHTFSSLSIDCFSCHGDVDLKHNSNSSLVLFAAKREDSARVTVSVCAQCHVRTGKSRSSGLPYANNFIPGDNLFRDFEVSFADKSLVSLNLVDRHILENVRDVIRLGNDSVTCMTCHKVHQSSSDRHQRLPKESAICANCHDSKSGEWTTKTFKKHSDLCRY